MQELQNRMSASEFQDWKAFYLLEPFDGIRDDHRAGVIAATIANVFKKKSATRFTPADFFPPFAKSNQSWEEQLQIVQMMNVALGGKDMRKPGN